MFIGICIVNTLKDQSAERQHPQWAVYGWLPTDFGCPTAFCLRFEHWFCVLLKSRHGLCVLC